MAISRENPQKQEEAPQAPPPELLSTARYPVHNLFIGPAGLHAGWRLPVFVFLATALGITFGRLTLLWHPRGAGKLWQDWLIEFELFLAVLIAGAVMAKIERRPLRTFGLPLSDAFRKHFWMGALWGFIWLTVLMLALRLTGAFYFGGLAIHGVRILKFAAYYALLFLTVALFEEFAVRGYPLFTLAQNMRFWPAAILLSIIFGAMHYSNSGEGWVGLLGAAMVGLFFCLTVRRTGTLWFAVGFHASWDWGEAISIPFLTAGESRPGICCTRRFTDRIGSPVAASVRRAVCWFSW